MYRYKYGIVHWQRRSTVLDVVDGSIKRMARVALCFDASEEWLGVFLVESPVKRNNDMLGGKPTKCITGGMP